MAAAAARACPVKFYSGTRVRGVNGGGAGTETAEAVVKGFDGDGGGGGGGSEGIRRDCDGGEGIRRGSNDGGGGGGGGPMDPSGVQAPGAVAIPRVCPTTLTRWPPPTRHHYTPVHTKSAERITSQCFVDISHRRPSGTSGAFLFARSYFFHFPTAHKSVRPIARIDVRTSVNSC